MTRSTLHPSNQPHRALPPCVEPLPSLWDPDAEPADAFVAWLEHKLACCRESARVSQVTGSGSPPTADIEVAPLR
jgi:hypothetical protein